jgi:hypothetical protein
MVATLASLVAACASAPIMPLPRPAPDAKGEVIVYRESAFAAGGVNLSVGSGNVAFASIANSEKVRATLSIGEHEIFVQARNAEPTRVRVTIRKEGLVCLRTSSSPSTYAKVAIPVTLILTGYHFYLDEVPCPQTAELSKYKDVLVSYQ